MSRARLEVEIDAPAGVVMAVVTDFERYPAFLPWMQAAAVLRHEHPAPGDPGEAWEVRFQVEVIRPLVYTLRLEREGVSALRWSLVEGVFRANDGAWLLAPLDEGRRTLATYEIELQTGSFVPTHILRSLVGRDLPELLQRVKAEAERRGAGA